MKTLFPILMLLVAVALGGCVSMLLPKEAKTQIKAGVAAYKEQSPEVKATTRMELDALTTPCKVRLWCPGDPYPDFGLPSALERPAQ